MASKQRRPEQERPVEPEAEHRVTVDQAREHRCDLIVMGASEGLLSGSSVGNNIKSVLKKSKVPVLVVPAHAG